jgi:hypothetical protein
MPNAAEMVDEAVALGFPSGATGQTQDRERSLGDPGRLSQGSGKLGYDLCMQLPSCHNKDDLRLLLHPCCDECCVAFFSAYGGTEKSPEHILRIL